MKKWLYVCASVLLAGLLTPSAQAASSEMEILLKLLEKKGILTADEAQGIAKETKATVQEAAKAEKEASPKKDTVKGWEPPEWLKNTTVKGDFRLRGEIYDRADGLGTRTPTAGTQERARYRLRVGAETKITDEVMVGFGLGSGEPVSTSGYGNSRSANQTFSSSFTRKPIWIDYAYAKYQPVKWLSLLGGKFNNPVWQPADFVFTNDINPEGAAIKLAGSISPYVDLFFDGAFYILEERSADPDAIMFIAQPGVKLNFTKDSSLKLTAAYYGYENVTNYGILTPGSATTNTLWTTRSRRDKYRYEYNAFVFGGELGFNKPFGFAAIPYVGILGGYLFNQDPRTDGKAYIAGFNLGYPSVAKAADWNFEYTFRRYEKDALLDIFTDSSFYKGATNAMGHRIKFAYGLAKNTSVGLNYYNTWTVRPTPSLTNRHGNPSTENVGQIDFMFKF